MNLPFWATLISLYLAGTFLGPADAKTIHGCNLTQYARCPNANLAGADLRKANLVGADFRGASLVGANLKGANLSGATLKQANLSGANLNTANLTGSGLQFAVLNGASLIRASLKSSDLYKANLHAADLRQANLFAANLTGATLSGANLTGADMALVTFDGPSQSAEEFGPAISVGSRGPAGGLVFYVAPDGHHGLEAALASQTATSWGCPTISVPKTLVGIGTGSFNTQLILAACPDAGSAAQVASVYTQNGYRDWFVPSKDEMALLMPFVDQFNFSYWTSSQAAPTSVWAWYWNSFATGTGPNQLTYSQSFQATKSGGSTLTPAPPLVTAVYPVRHF